MQPPDLERRLSAILSADAVGYSRLMAEDQTATVRLITVYRKTITDLTEEHRGRIVDAPGDNVLAELPTATDAVEAAVEIQRVLQARNESLPENRRMHFRIGVHLGDITAEGDRVYGDGVNVAARIEAIAEPGGICVSTAVREQLRQDSRLAWEDLGDKTLKNIPTPVRVFRLRFDDQKPSLAKSTRSSASRMSRAVIPLTLLLALLLGVTLLRPREHDTPPRTLADLSAPESHWAVPLPSGERLQLPGLGGRFDYSRLIAISPDGHRIVYTASDAERRSQLFLREIDSILAQPISGTENARAPFFSPDGEWLGFLATEHLMKVSLRGGSPQEICRIGRVISFDATWSPDGENIISGTDDGLWRVASTGGVPEQLTKPDSARGEVGHHSPKFAADGKSILFTVSATPDMHVARLTVDSREWQYLVRDAYGGVHLTRTQETF